MATDGNEASLTVVIVGGAGAMGRWATRYIARLGSAERLLIADIDEARAQRLVDEVGGPCAAVALDATDETALRKVFSGCDVVLNTMGPFSIFARPVLEAATDCGCDYLDIDDDWESTLEAFELDARAREQGCRVVKGIGGSPGFSNLCAMVAVGRLDRVEEIITGWSMRGAVVEDEAAYLDGSSAGAAVEHWLIQLSGTIRAWRDGSEEEVKPLQPVEFDYPGIGPVRTYTVGHPEAVTLPRYVDGIVTSMNVMSGPEWLFEYARTVAADYEAGKITLAEGALQLENPPQPAERGPRDPLASAWALARGERDGKPLAISVESPAKPRGKMGGGTGASLAIGLELLRRGEIAEVGVNAPEGVIDPDAFFPLYGKLGDPEVSSADEALLVRELADAPIPVLGSA
ncbi:MAG TPA: saccharopine dehydrogenase NADP-binding domain-containing protein [Solirubrobacterales bacterium]|nr:saccharopine dehydrogenase NADP-binding domain-containing protein [Solirubrobacterales bacterium]